GGPEKDARRAALAQPLDARGEQLLGDAGAARLLAHGDVVNEAGRAAKLLPRQRLERDVDVARDLAGLLRDEDAAIGRFDDAAEKRRVAALGRLTGRKEASSVERVMRPHQHRTEAAEGGKIAPLGPTDGHGHFCSLVVERFCLMALGY